MRTLLSLSKEVASALPPESPFDHAAYTEGRLAAVAATLAQLAEVAGDLPLNREDVAVGFGCLGIPHQGDPPSLQSHRIACRQISDLASSPTEAAKDTSSPTEVAKDTSMAKRASSLGRLASILERVPDTFAIAAIAVRDAAELRFMQRAIEFDRYNLALSRVRRMVKKYEKNIKAGGDDLLAHCLESAWVDYCWALDPPDEAETTDTGTRTWMVKLQTRCAKAVEAWRRVWISRSPRPTSQDGTLLHDTLLKVSEAIGPFPR